MDVQTESNQATTRERVDLPSRLRSRHLLSIADLSPEEIVFILDTAEVMKEIGSRPIKKVPTLRARPSSMCSLSRARGLGCRSNLRRSD